MKKIIAVISAFLLICAALVSCTSVSGNTNLNKYTDEVHGFSFCFDTDWSENKADIGYSVRSAAGSDGLSEAVIFVFTEKTEKTAAELCDAQYNSILPFTSEQEKGDTDTETDFDGIKGASLTYNYKVGDNAYTSKSAVCVKDGLAVKFLLNAPQSSFSSYTDCLDTILLNFEFITPTEPSSETGDCSDGEFESVVEDYRFTCPDNWYISRADGLASVKPKGGNASISVYAYSLESDKTGYAANEYWKTLDESLKSSLPGYTLTKEYGTEENPEPKLGGTVAVRKEYSAVIGGVAFNYIQVICLRNGYVYSVLFTSDSAEYDIYKGAFDSFVDSFVFE